jgi:trans-aconitate 2-methyltransferase
MAAKDFGSIETDYAFFMAHATEADSDAREYARELAGFAEGRLSIRLLDFGCGTGEFTHRLLAMLDWPPQGLEITLVEPVRDQREAAVQRLAHFSLQAIDSLESLPTVPESRFDVLLSNHVLYYVEDLAETLRRMRTLLRPGGKLLLAIAGWDNALIQLWKIGFATLGRPVPYHVAEDVAAVLSRQGVLFQQSPSRYLLRFPDTEENRLGILRFLFGDYLRQMSLPRLLSEFDRYARSGHVEVDTHSEHFRVEPA